KAGTLHNSAKRWSSSNFELKDLQSLDPRYRGDDGLVQGGSLAPMSTGPHARNRVRHDPFGGFGWECDGAWCRPRTHAARAFGGRAGARRVSAVAPGSAGH